MVDPKIEEYAPDTTKEKMAGTPEPLKDKSTLTITDPDAPVNHDGYVLVDGVLVAKELAQ